jgi:hypothetical protein
MTTTIKLPVIKHTKSKARTFYTYGLFVIPLCYLILILFFDDKNNQLGKAFLLIYILFFTIGLFKKKPRKKDGFLIINKDNIIHTQQDNEVTRFSLDLLADITFIYMGYEGRANTFSLLMDPGDENELQFKYKGQKFCYNVYLKHEYLPLLRKLFKECETAGKKVIIKNSHGVRTKF